MKILKILPLIEWSDKMPFDSTIKDLLEEKLCLSKYLTPENINTFYNAMNQYFKQKRFSYSYFANLLNTTIDFCQFLDLSFGEIIGIINNHPAIIHANKEELLAKYLLLAVLPDENEKSVRRDILLNHPKYLIVGLSTMYARYSYLSAHDMGNNISKYYLLKMTNKEFENTFKISAEQLKAEYPTPDTLELIQKLLAWPENVDLKAKIEKMAQRR